VQPLVNLPIKLSGIAGKSKSFKLAGLGFDLADRSCLVASPA